MKQLQEYNQKRNFKKTPEPRAEVRKAKSPKSLFVVQEHHASHLHYDFRLELNGVLKSWAVPKGPSLDPSIKRLAVQVEDHPLPYANFEGSIPAGEYGGGDVYIWDRGTWETEGDAEEGLRKGRLEFTLKGKKLKGKWLLIRTKRSSSKPQWILIKRSDAYAQEGDRDIAMVHDHLNPEIKETPETRKNPQTKKTIQTKKIRETQTKKVESRKSKNPSTKGETPGFIDPQLALLVETPPEGSEWIHETKYDGYRTQAHVRSGNVHLLTRSAQNWTEKYPSVTRALEKLKVESAVFDGEIVWIDENGRSDFQKLQNALKEKESTSILYYVFDLLELNGEDLRALPLMERKKKLEKLLSPLKGTAVLYSEHLEGNAEQFLGSSCDLSLEGIVSKRKDSVYLSGRNDHWVKAKCQQRQEFVIAGFTEGEGSRLGFGALLLGVYENEKLHYVGRVGTGFSSESLISLKERLCKLEQKRSPFDLKPPRGSGVHWVRPELVAEVTFANWTSDGLLRVPVFQGLREDKPALEIRREKAVHAPKNTKLSRTLTHPEKLMYSKEGITKIQIARFYEEISEWMLPHLSGRPLSLIRCPRGTSESCFFQKHATGKMASQIRQIRIKEKTGTRQYLFIDSLDGLWALVQQGTVELHGWNSREKDVLHPDQLVLDLDPGPHVPWKRTVTAAFAIKEILENKGLRSFVKVTGGKGIHIHVPIEPLYPWDQIKNFSESLARHMEQAEPNLYTTSSVKAARKDKIYIDYLRNAQSATAVIPYSLRARKQSSVALPLEWSELEQIPGADFFTLEKSLLKVKNRKQDPWKSFSTSARKIKDLSASARKK